MPTAAHLLRLASEAEPRTPTDAELLARYATDRDEEAFAELVRRNGPLVLRACRHLLGEAGADDAFQATFLTLVRKAARLGRHSSLAGWLHATAVHIARNARRADIRARRREAAYDAPRATAPDDLTWREVRERIDAELAALPEKYRLPLVLCCVQELGYDEAARRAGCSIGALRGRLERGKERLRIRLARYGLPLALPVLVLGPPAPVSAAVERATLETARAMATGGRIPDAVAGLVATRSWLRAALVAPGAAVLVFGAVLAASAVPRAEPPKADPPKPAPGAAPGPQVAADNHGDPLPAGAVMRLGTARLRHGEWVRSVAFSPDGTEVTSAGFDGTVRTWDVKTGKEIRRLKGPFVEPHAVAYAAGGKQIVTAEAWYSTRDRQPVRVWDAKTGESVRTVVEQGPRSNDGFALSPDGKTIAYSADEAVVVLPLASGEKPLAQLPAGGRKVSHLAFTPSGTGLLVCCSGEFLRNTPADEPFGVRLFDLTKPAEPVWRREGKHADAWGRYPAAVATPDGKHVLVSFNYKEQPVLLDAATGKELRKFDGKGVAIHPFLFLPEGPSAKPEGFGKRVFTLTAGGPGTIWDLATGKPVEKWPGEDVDVLGGAVLSPDGKTVATAGHRAVGLWDAATGRPLHPTGAARGQVDRLAVFPDGKRVLAGSDSDPESGARVWNLDTGRQVAALPHKSASAAPAPDGKTFAVGYFRGVPDVVDAASGKVLRKSSGDPLFLDSLSYGLGGKVLIGTGWTDRNVRLWEADTLKPLPPMAEAFPASGGTRSLAVTPDGATLVAAGMDGVVRVWDIAARKEVRNFTVGKRGDWKLALSTDGRFAVTGAAREKYGFTAGDAGGANDLKMWDLATGAVRVTLDDPKSSTNCLAFAPDGRTVAVGSQDGVARVYEVATGKSRAEFRGHEGPVTAVAFTPDGKRLLSGGSDTTVLVWDLLAPSPNVAGPADAAAAWADLLGADAGRADRAMRSLTRNPAEAVAQIGKHLKAEPEPEAKRVRGLVEQLEAPAFADREKAQAELERLGSAVVPALKDAIRTTDSTELARRARELVSRLERATLTGEALRQARAVEVLERIGSPEARKQLAELARGAAGARLTRDATAALGRLESKR